jgi:hypothetical protein
MGNLPAGDVAHLTHIAGLHYAGQINFNYFDVSNPAAFSNGKEADRAR